jgi:alkylation response protein AidB-like acyl-CoA dehydrogenase
MDFTFTDEQQAVGEAAAGVFDGLVGPERVAEVELTDDRVDRELWAALAAADLLGLAVPADHGGQGLGLTELCLVLESQGRCVAPVPLWATLVLGALPLARFGTADLAARWLPGVASGEIFLSAALAGTAASVSGSPVVTAEPVGDRGPNGWRLDGTELAVPQAHLAARVLVPARTPGGDVLLALVDPLCEGVRLERAVTTNREVHPHLHFSGAVVEPADVVAGPETGAVALRWTLEAAWTGLSALAVGVCESALRQTAAYLNQRHQFERPLSAFQGTMLRAADAAIDIEAIRVTLWQAAWRIDTGRPASEEVAVAKWQAAERGQRVVHATQHLHGGMGADVTYPIHRYFLWGKQLELLLGGPSSQLARLGTLIAQRVTEGAG